MVQQKNIKQLTLQKKFYTSGRSLLQERLEQYQTPLTVYQLNKMYTGTFTFLPADKDWLYDPTRNPYYNCPVLLIIISNST